jgi:hypothetical protein
MLSSQANITELDYQEVMVLTIEGFGSLISIVLARQDKIYELN